MKNLRWRPVFRWDKQNKLLRLFRIMWEHGKGEIGYAWAMERAYSVKLSFALEVKLPDLWVGAFWKKGRDELTVWLCLLPCVPLRVHFRKSYSGRFA